jgi:hypothetical protein
VALAIAKRRPTALGWLAVNLARFLATWEGVGSVVAAAVMIGEGDGFAAPRSLEEILSVPVFLVVFAVMSAFATTVGLFLFAPAWISGLVVYLVALWWCGRAVPSRLRRAAAVALSPLVAAFFFAGGIQWLSVQLAALAGAIVYGCVVKLPTAPDGVQFGGPPPGRPPRRPGGDSL